MKYVREALSKPPFELNSEDVPMFVSVGFDDNGISGINKKELFGITWVTNLFASLKNPVGKKNHTTFDGDSCSCSFYFATKYLTDECDDTDPASLRYAWIKAIEAGHEAGCHTHSHPHGRKMSTTEWIKEIVLCKEHLCSLKSSLSLVGFRTPFLEYNTNTFEAIKKCGFLYDCSIEEGWQIDQDGTNFIWPYTLDSISPGHNVQQISDNDMPKLGTYSGLWEMPLHVVIVPPDDLCEKYGVKQGFRNRLKPKYSVFDPSNGKITGLDWNLLVDFQMNKEEFLATLKYTLDLRIMGNRAPMLFGAHSDLYSPEYYFPKNITWRERQYVIKEFLEYALSYDCVRVVSLEKVLEWLNQP